MNDKLISQVEKTKTVKYIFCDYYDTVIHRRVHPLEPFRIWAKTIKNQLSIKLSSSKIYNLRRSSVRFLSKKMDMVETEMPYTVVIREVYDRMVNLNAIESQIDFNTFLKTSYEADYQSESSVQYLNEEMIESLRFLKTKGYHIYCVSDFHSDEVFLNRLLQFHGIAGIYKETYVSASQKASKENAGILYSNILEKENILPNQVIMIGDNFTSDVKNARLQGISAFHLKNQGIGFKQKYQFFVLSLKNLLSL